MAYDFFTGSRLGLEEKFEIVVRRQADEVGLSGLVDSLSFSAAVRLVAVHRGSFEFAPQVFDFQLITALLARRIDFGRFLAHTDYHSFTIVVAFPPFFVILSRNTCNEGF